MVCLRFPLSSKKDGDKGQRDFEFQSGGFPETRELIAGNWQKGSSVLFEKNKTIVGRFAVKGEKKNGRRKIGTTSLDVLEEDRNTGGASYADEVTLVLAIKRCKARRDVVDVVARALCTPYVVLLDFVDFCRFLSIFPRL